MKHRVFLSMIGIMLQGAVFSFQAADKTEVKKSEKIAIYIPCKSRISWDAYYQAWCDAVDCNKEDYASYTDFQKQFEAEKFIVSTELRARPAGKILNPYTRFLWLCMGEAWYQDQLAQMKTRNAARRIAKPTPKPEMTFADFEKFQLREGGPKNFMLTTQGREEVVYFAMQHEQYSSIVEKFSEEKKIAPETTKKMLILAQEYRQAFLEMKQQGILQ